MSALLFLQDGLHVRAHARRRATAPATVSLHGYGEQIHAANMLLYLLWTSMHQAPTSPCETMCRCAYIGKSLPIAAKRCDGTGKVRDTLSQTTGMRRPCDHTFCRARCWRRGKSWAVSIRPSGMMRPLSCSSAPPRMPDRRHAALHSSEIHAPP